MYPLSANIEKESFSESCRIPSRSDYTVAGRGDSEGIFIPDRLWEMYGIFDCIVVRLDLEFLNQQLVGRVGLCHAQIYFA